jgi:ubiquinone/menaquinone biosynthesis C-methylase UbiE
MEDGMEDPFGTFARFYDLDYAGMEADLPMLGQFAARCGSPILELACGTGRVLLPLARQGYQVTGVDVSAAMLDRTRHKVSSEGLEERVCLAQQDMRDLELDSPFSFVFVVSSSFQHLLTIDDQLAVLARVRRHLSPGGLFLVDLFNPDLSRLLDFQGRVTLDKIMTDPETGRPILKYHSQTVDLGQQTVYTTLIMDELDDRGQVQRTLFPFPLRYMFRGEVELLLRHAGFALEAVYGSYDLDEYSGDSERLIAVAHRTD